MAFLLIGWKAAWFFAQDGCLDAGGRWENKTCIGLSDAAASGGDLENFAELPARPDGPLVDTASVLSVDEEEELTARLENHNANTKHPLVIATIATTNGQGIAHFTDVLANRWGVGQEGRGVMVLIAVADRRMSISVADGTLGMLPNERSAQIVKDEMTPPLRSGHFYAALAAAVGAIAEATSRDVPVPR